ncbi:hypothetical protein Cni_G05101 [Canna indica]|uniref:Transcription factor MYC/MYB N-terminal domain-containing protein n=1 Tax=Canna indica TaxID=4628 RepID=A0AAQ3JU58_9LILI|nr:hypothetical protein Cni_G05101 [Canna indica]
MEEQVMNPLALAHLLQHTLRSLCINNSPWLYAVFWRILPRNHPPPIWDLEGRTRGTARNRSNWILVWEDGFCNFSSSKQVIGADQHHTLQPELFFRMSHEIHNCGEGLIGKVAVGELEGYKWVFKELWVDETRNVFLKSSTNIPLNYQPKSWDSHFQSGIKTIGLIKVREGVLQLGSFNKVMEDLSYVAAIRDKFDYLGSIPGFLLPRPCSTRHHAVVDNSAAKRHHDEQQQHLQVLKPTAEYDLVAPALPGFTEEVMEVDEGMQLWETKDQDECFWMIN